MLKAGKQIPNNFEKMGMPAKEGRTLFRTGNRRDGLADGRDVGKCVVCRTLYLI